MTNPAQPDTIASLEAALRRLRLCDIEEDRSKPQSVGALKALRAALSLADTKPTEPALVRQLQTKLVTALEKLLQCHLRENGGIPGSVGAVAAATAALAQVQRAGR